MSFLVVENLVKKFGDFVAVDDVTINMERGKVCTLLGPSGCGKTTTLRSIAGLEIFNSGRVSIEGEVLAEPHNGVFVAPENRGLGMVFQSYALWPHKSVGENVSLGLKIQGMNQGEISDRVSGVLEMVGMPGTEDRFPSSLSGGQQQRIALARALALQPRCLLFDEPLSNLDLLLRERMRFEIRELLVKLGITAVYVTHDQSEAMVISDHIVVMNHGLVQQEGPPREIYTNPDNRFTAEFLGGTNVIELDVQASDPENGIVAAPGGLKFKSLGASKLKNSNERMLIAFRPEMMRGEGEAEGCDNTFDATVRSSSFLGTHTQLEVELAGHKVTVNLPGNQTQQPGDRMKIGVNEQHVLLIVDNEAVSEENAAA